LRKSPCVLIIAGSDSGGGAGIQADLKTCAALGVHGMTAITSITAQNTMEVTAVQDILPEIVKAQIDAVVGDIGVDVAKTGMLHTSEIIEVVTNEIGEHRFPVVVDPVMVSKGGAPLLKPEAVTTLVKKLLPLTTVITPNAMEAEALAGLKVKSLEEAKTAAKRIAELGPKAVVIKGGHTSEEKAIDVLYSNGDFKIFESERIETKTTHGSGCTFASAIAAELAKGRSIVDAVAASKEFITKAIKFGLSIGHGFGPVNSMASLYNAAEKYAINENMKEAAEILENCPEIVNIIPEVQMNMAMALPYAGTYLDVMAIPGRIVRMGKRVRVASCPEFGASNHVARAILSLMKYEPAIRAALNLKYSESLVRICEKLGLITSFYDRKEEPAEIKMIEGATISWGVEQAIKRVGRVPSVIYHTGDVGREPMIILFGRTVVEVAKVAVEIAKEYSPPHAF